MPVLSIDAADVSRIAAVAIARHPELELLGVALEGGSDYAEILVRLRGCRAEPCMVTVGVFRDLSADNLRAEIDKLLAEHLHQHRQDRR